MGEIRPHDMSTARCVFWDAMLYVPLTLVLMTLAGRKPIEENKLDAIIKVLSVLTTRAE